MFEYSYICINNKELKEILTKIDLSWKTKYIGRQIIDDAYYNILVNNNYYLENAQYERNNIVVNMSVVLDKDGYISEISTYKIKNKNYGHGRPCVEDRELTKSDISHFSKVLDTVTVDDAESLYNILKKSFSKDELLAEGHKFIKANSKGLLLMTPSGEEKLLSKDTLLQILTISRSFIDILFSEQTMKLVPECIREEEIPLYISVLSKVNTSKYRNYSALIEDAERRRLLAASKSGYPELVSAVRSEHREKIASLIEFAPLVIADSENTESPIIIATRQNNIEVLKLLLDNGAFSRDTRLDESGNFVSPLQIAVQNKNHEIIKLLCQYNGAEADKDSESKYNYWLINQPPKFKISDVFKTIGEKQDFEALKIILPYVSRNEYKVSFDPLVFEQLSDDDVDFIISIEGASVIWPADIVNKVYFIDRDKCYKMVQQGCNIETADFFIEENDYDMFAKAISHHSNIYPRESYKKVYERGGQWYKTLKKAFSPQFNYSVLRQDVNKYLENFIREEKFEAFKLGIQRLETGFPISTLNAFCNYPKDKKATKELQAFLEYVLYNCDYKEHLEDHSTEDDVAFSFFTDALLCHATSDAIKDYLKKYSLKITHKDKVFEGRFVDLVENRNDDAFVELLKVKLASDESRRPTHDWIALSGFTEYKNKTIYDVFKTIVMSYKFTERDLVNNFSWTNKEKAQKLEKRWKEALCKFISVVPLEEQDEIIKNFKYKRHKEANTALEFAIAEQIQSEEFLSILR